MDQPASDSFCPNKSCFFFPSLLGGASYPVLQPHPEDENYSIMTDSSSGFVGSLTDQNPTFNSQILVGDDALNINTGANLVPQNSGTQFLPFPCAWDNDDDGIASDFTSDANFNPLLIQKRLAFMHNAGEHFDKPFHMPPPPPPVPVVDGLSRLPIFNFHGSSSNNKKFECDTSSNVDEEVIHKVLDLQEEPAPVEDYFQGEDGNQGLEFDKNDVSNANSCSVITGNHDRGQKAGKLPAKNLMAERRRRKKLNDRLYMLRSVIPKISKVQKDQIPKLLVFLLHLFITP